MELHKFLLVLLLLTSTILVASGDTSVHESSIDHPRHHHHHRHRHHRHSHQYYVDQRNKKYGFDKLFVFGDSYADTGNIQKSLGNSWKPPYGITFPGKPAGRFSDGRVLTDYIAKYYGIKSPVAYRWIKYFPKKLRSGVNFAYGGTGVLDTLVPEPNMTTQIDFFQQLLDNKVYNKVDLQSALFLVSLAGNDYSAYIAKGGIAEGLPAFITSVIKQLGVNLKRLRSLGARKIAVTGLEPLGCLPVNTVQTSFQQCNATANTAVAFHNVLLNEAVSKLNIEIGYNACTVLDLFNSFTTVLMHKGDITGSLKFETPLKPCCMGISPTDRCGSVDENGKKLYVVCNDTNSAFFWDGVHPTQAGWHAVSLALKPVLDQIV
ncbi:OLC1v1034264C1 [Oldenlandia corymbosa var. corymbosa]|uniref:OLC1v1034264C1 n=1 Tax=Oldenlandia corymbosa var. corymbosa TaxID=529605 RepID=A0AAV1CQX5_OLDCO|nr:OLC1v1034264C1 [Oldenlandia corymbosa var. corymbosa]